MDDFENVTKLIEEGANVNVKNSMGQTPLHFVGRNKDDKITKELLKASANPNGTAPQIAIERPLTLVKRMHEDASDDDESYGQVIKTLKAAGAQG